MTEPAHSIVLRAPTANGKSPNGHTAMQLLDALKFYVANGDVDRAVYCATEYIPLFARVDNSYTVRSGFLQALQQLFWFKVDCRHLRYVLGHYEAMTRYLGPASSRSDADVDYLAVVIARYVTALTCAPKTTLVGDLSALFCPRLVPFLREAQEVGELSSDDADSEDDYRWLRCTAKAAEPDTARLVLRDEHVDDPTRSDRDTSQHANCLSITGIVQRTVGVRQFDNHGTSVLRGLFYSLQRRSFRAIHWALICLGDDFGATPFSSIAGQTDCETSRHYLLSLLRSLKLYSRACIDNERAEFLNALQDYAQSCPWRRLKEADVAIAAVLLLIQDPFTVDRSTDRASPKRSIDTDDCYAWTREEISDLVCKKQALAEFSRARRIRDLTQRVATLTSCTNQQPPSHPNLRAVGIEFLMQQMQTVRVQSDGRRKRARAVSQDS